MYQMSTSSPVWWLAWPVDRAAARLGDVADVEAAPAGPDGGAAQVLDEVDHRRVAPVVVAAEAASPARSGRSRAAARRRRGSRATALADRVGRVRRGRALGARRARGRSGPRRARARAASARQAASRRADHARVSRTARCRFSPSIAAPSPIRKSRITGLTPSRCEPVAAVTAAISAGPMKAVARPESAKRPKAWAGATRPSAWWTSSVREAACSAPAGGAEQAAGQP